MTSPLRILIGVTAEFKSSLFYFNQKNIFCLKIIHFLDALTFPLFQSSTLGIDFLIHIFSQMLKHMEQTVNDSQTVIQIVGDLGVNFVARGQYST